MNRLILTLALLASTATGTMGQDQNTPTLPAPAPATAPAPSDAPAAIMKIDAPTFVRRVMAMNDYETDTARLAETRSGNAAVKAYAARMIADHEALASHLGEMVTRDGIAPGSTGAVTAPADPAEAEVLTALNAAEGEAFDRLYLDAQAKAHADAIRLFTDYAESGDNAGLRDFAVSTLPKLQEHQHAVAELQTAD